jgi:hypothetical protein
MYTKEEINLRAVQNWAFESGYFDGMITNTANYKDVPMYLLCSSLYEERLPQWLHCLLLSVLHQNELFGGNTWWFFVHNQIIPIWSPIPQIIRTRRFIYDVQVSMKKGFNSQQWLHCLLSIGGNTWWFFVCNQLILNTLTSSVSNSCTLWLDDE